MAKIMRPPAVFGFSHDQPLKDTRSMVESGEGGDLWNSIHVAPTKKDRKSVPRSKFSKGPSMFDIMRKQLGLSSPYPEAHDPWIQVEKRSGPVKRLKATHVEGPNVLGSLTA